MEGGGVGHQWRFFSKLIPNCVSVRLALQLCSWPMRWWNENPEMGPLVKKLLQAQGDKTWNTAVGALQRDRCGRPSKKEAIKTERLFEQTRGEESEICDFF